jgi:hypothetical protein
VGNLGAVVGLVACALAAGCAGRPALQSAKPVVTSAVLAPVPVPPPTVAASPDPVIITLDTGAPEVSFGRIEVVPDGALLAHLGRTVPGDGDHEPCHALRIDATGSTSVVTTRCLTEYEELPSPDGAKTLRLVARRPMAALMAPIMDVFVEDNATRERWWVDHGWFRRLEGGLPALWSVRGHRLLLPGPQPLAYDADTHRVWKVRESGLAWALDDDGERVAIAMPDRRVRVAQIESHDAPLILPEAPEGTAHLALSGDRLAAVTADGAVTVWALSRQVIVASWEVAFHPTQVVWVGGGVTLAIADAQRVSLARLD